MEIEKNKHYLWRKKVTVHKDIKKVEELEGISRESLPKINHKDPLIKLFFEKNSVKIGDILEIIRKSDESQKYFRVVI